MKLNRVRVIIERTVKVVLTFTVDIISNRQVIYSSLFSSAHSSSTGSFKCCFKFLSIWFKLKENTIKSENDVTDLRQDTILSFYIAGYSCECFSNTATTWNISWQRNTIFWYWNSQIFHLKYLWLHKLLQPIMVFFYGFQCLCLCAAANSRDTQKYCIVQSYSNISWWRLKLNINQQM